MFWLQLGSFDWQCLLGNYAKFARFASIDYNNNNNQSSPAVVVVVFVGLRRLWDLFLKIFIDFGFGFVCCLALLLSAVLVHTFCLFLPCPLAQLISVSGGLIRQTTAVCNDKLVWPSRYKYVYICILEREIQSVNALCWGYIVPKRDSAMLKLTLGTHTHTHRT